MQISEELNIKLLLSKNSVTNNDGNRKISDYAGLITVSRILDKVLIYCR